jgi:polyisoprenoid-binding protein YceI
VRSPFAPVALPLAALIGALVRWWMQGSGNVFTATSKRFYIPDPDLGWRISNERAIWLGLEVAAVIAGIAVALVVAGWIIRWREAKRGQRASVLRAASWIVGGIPLAVPIIAFASGAGPANGVDTLPPAQIHAIEAGIVGFIDAPDGHYDIVEHSGTTVIGQPTAERETFDARFGGIRGGWHGDPRDLGKPMSAMISVDAASVDTGIALRSKHAREEFLHTDRFPRISVELDRLLAARQAGANAVAFRAHGTLGFMGGTHSIEVTGTLKKPDAAALARLGLIQSGQSGQSGPGGEILLVQADFALVIKETALASDAGNFDGDRIPVHVQLVMRHTSG